MSKELYQSSPEFVDTRFMTAKEKKAAWQNFKRVIDERDSGLINRPLYNHLHVHCSFIAHYSIYGFRDEYKARFPDFIAHFDKNSKYNGPGYYNSLWMIDPDYQDLNSLMVAYVTAQAPKIYREIEEEQRQIELALLKKLAEKHGYMAIAEKVIQTPEIRGEQASLFE
ncbi:MAG: hypothetical protein ACYCX4_00485 [Bacillota bacterium]